MGQGDVAAATCAGGLSCALPRPPGLPCHPLPAASQFALHLRQLAMARWWQEVVDRSVAVWRRELRWLLEQTAVAANMAKVGWQVRARAQVHARMVPCVGVAFACAHLFIGGPILAEWSACGSCGFEWRILPRLRLCCLQHFAAVVPEEVRRVLCGTPGQPGHLERAQQMYVETRAKFCAAMLDAEVTQVGCHTSAAALSLGRAIT